MVNTLFNYKVFFNMIDTSFFVSILLIIAINFITNNMSKKDKVTNHIKRVSICSFIQILLITLLNQIILFENKLWYPYEYTIYAFLILNEIILLASTFNFVKFLSELKVLPKTSNNILYSIPIVIYIIFLSSIILFKLQEFTLDMYIIFSTIIFTYYYILNLVFYIKNIKMFKNKFKSVLNIFFILTLIVKVLSLSFKLQTIFWPAYILCIIMFLIYLKTIRNLTEHITGLYNMEALNLAMQDKKYIQDNKFTLITFDNLDEITEKYGMNSRYSSLNSFSRILKKSICKHYTCYYIGNNNILIDFNNETDSKIDEILIIIQNKLKSISIYSKSDFTLTFSSKTETYTTDRFETYLDLIKYLYYTSYKEILEKKSLQ